MIDPQPTIVIHVDEETLAITGETIAVKTASVTTGTISIDADDDTPTVTIPISGETVVAVRSPDLANVVVPGPETVVVRAVGVMGPPGADGAVGGAYEHLQAIPSDTWTVSHGLGYWPNVAIVDTLGRQVQGEVSYPDLNTVVISFTAAFSGRAFLS